jgi:prepilin-type N-terminal cleavage/methylation domain-containing protein
MLRPGNHRTRGFVLVEILLVIAIIALLAGAYYGLKGGNEGNTSEDKSIPARSIDKGHSVECMNNLSQLRMAIQMETDPVDGTLPDKLPDLGSSVMKCPVSGKPYVYDPKTGKVHCTTPGHESF